MTYKEAVRSGYSDGDLLKYAHAGSNKYYNFRFYEISDDITITVNYESVEAEVVDAKGYFESIKYDTVPVGSDASVTDNTLTVPSQYLRETDAYSYRIAIKPGAASLAGIQVSDDTGTYTQDFLIADGTLQTYTAEGLGTIKFAYTGGVCFIRVYSQTAGKLFFTPAVYGDLDRNLEIEEEDIARLRKILVGEWKTTTLADYDRNGSIDVKDIVRMKNYLVQDIKKIVCIGDSITYGYTISSASDTYPSVLEGLFRNERQNVEVVNCGKSSSYILNPDNPYSVKKNMKDRWYPNTEEYRRSPICGADTVIIMLGTNDARSFTDTSVKNAFMSDLSDLIMTYKNLECVKNVYVVASPPAYSSADLKFALDGQIQKLQEQVAETTGAVFIDLNSYIYDDITWDLTCLAGDKLHPTATCLLYTSDAATT